MNAEKRKRLEAAGFEEVSVAQVLALSPEESALIEMRVALSNTLRERRKQAHITQGELAVKIGSSQSRIAKAETGDPSVAIDLLIRALLAVGATRREVGTALAC